MVDPWRPDPGVLEVNLPPASNWDELEQINTVLFEEARQWVENELEKWAAVARTAKIDPQ